MSFCFHSSSLGFESRRAILSLCELLLARRLLAVSDPLLDRLQLVARLTRVLQSVDHHQLRVLLIAVPRARERHVDQIGRQCCRPARGDGEVLVGGRRKDHHLLARLLRDSQLVKLISHVRLVLCLLLQLRLCVRRLLLPLDRLLRPPREALARARQLLGARCRSKRQGVGGKALQRAPNGHCKAG